MGARLGVIVGMTIALILPTGVAEGAFSPATSYPVGASASAIGYGDFNGDGIIDLVVARPAENDVVVMLGKADGTVGQPSAAIPVGKDPVAVTSCISPYTYGLTGLAATIWWPGQLPSFRGDNHCDLAVSDAGSDDIAVLMGKGDGTFAPPLFVPADGSPGAIVGTVLDGNFPGIVFAEPQQNRLGVIHFGFNGTYTGPAWTSVGSDPEALITRPNSDGLSGAPAVVDVADTGSGDVRELVPSTDSSTQATILNPKGLWTVGSGPVALAAGSFGLAVADRDSGDVTLLGYQQTQQPQGAYAIHSVQSAPISVGPAPTGLATLTEVGAPAYGDLAVLHHGTGAISVLRQTPGSPQDGASWPSFSQTTVRVPGSPAAIIGQPIRPLLDYSVHTFAAPPATDLAALDPAGSVSVLLQQAPRLILTPSEPDELDTGRTAAGTSSTAEVTVTNAGQVPAPVGHVSMFQAPSPLWPQPFSFGPDRCSGRALAPGQSCTIAIRFAPQAPGSFADGMYAFGGSDQSSVFGVARFRGSAYLRANVSAPRVQLAANALLHGVRATGACSAACRLTVRALLWTRGAHAPGRTTVGVARARLVRGGKVRLRIALNARARRLARRRARIVLSSKVATTSYGTHSKRTMSLSLKQVVVVLRSS